MWDVLIETMSWFGVGFFGMLVGTGELVSRYRDEPGEAVFSKSGAFYIGINVLAAIFALALMRAFDVTFGLDPLAQTTALRWTEVLAAGFSAMAFFRCSLFNVRIANQDIPVGPQIFLETILAAADRAVDRNRGSSRYRLAEDLPIEGLAFEPTSIALPVLCFNLLQNVSPQTQADVRRQIKELTENQQIQELTKIRALLLLLMVVAGERLLQDALALYRADLGLKVPPEGPTI